MHSKGRCLLQITALKGLVEARKANALAQGKPANFDEWIVRVMGPGIADLFMRPYNFKVHSTAHKHANVCVTFRLDHQSPCGRSPCRVPLHFHIARCMCASDAVLRHIIRHTIAIVCPFRTCKHEPAWRHEVRVVQVWAIPTTGMQAEWLGERVATVDVDRAISNVIHSKEDAGWGPNAVFRRVPYNHVFTCCIWRAVMSTA